MSDDAARRALARLARKTGDHASGEDQASAPGGETPADDGDGGGESYRRTIERATEATRDVEAAADFREEVGLDALEAAVERADRSLSGSAADGRDALESFRAFEAAAAGDQFRSGRGTYLGGDAVARGK